MKFNSIREFLAYVEPHLKIGDAISVLTIFESVTDGTLSDEIIVQMNEAGVLLTRSNIVYRKKNISHAEFSNVLVHMLNTIADEIKKKCSSSGDIALNIQQIAQEYARRHAPNMEVVYGTEKNGIVS